MPLQQPIVHVVGSQLQAPLVLSQSCPVPHGEQAAPAVPQEVGDSDAHGWHVPFDVQQPFGHEVASQTQVPLVLSHSWPIGHIAHATPPVPHEALDSPA